MRYNRGYYEVVNYNIPDIELDLFVHVSNLREHRMHWQSGVEILCRLEGEVTVTVEGADYRVGPGDVLVIDSGLAHAYREGTEPGLHILLGFAGELLHRDGGMRIDLRTVGPGALRRADPEIEQLRTLCGRIAERCYPLFQARPLESPSMRELMRQNHLPLPPLQPVPVDSQTWHGVRADLHSLCQLLLRHTVPAEQPESRVTEDFARCVDYVQRHFAENLTADSIARACGFSRRSIFRLFQQQMGIPLGEYLSFLRVQAACAILERKSLPLSQVAEQVGLSTSQFYRVFQQVTGMTPREWQSGRLRREDPDRMALPWMHQSAAELRDWLNPQAGALDWDWIAGRRGWHFDG